MDDTTEALAAGLSSIHVDNADVGRAAVSALIELLQGKAVEHVHKTIGVRLIERRSVRKFY